METVLTYINNNQERFINELKQFLSYPSISTQKDHETDVQRCAAWLCDHLNAMGLLSTIHQTKRHPIVCGQKMVDPAKPTLMLYGHYDVQPVDPIDLWESPPFQPTIRNGNIYARGATDDKAQL